MSLVRIFALLAAALCGGALAHAQTSSDFASNRIEPLTTERTIEGGAYACTQDGAWCVARQAPYKVQYTRGARRLVGTLTPPTLEDDDELTVWPSLIRLSRRGQARDAFVGLVRTKSEPYSGGSFQASWLSLYEIRAYANEAATPIAEFPLSGDVSIRACFDQDDVRARRNACADEYTYRGTFGLDRARESGQPRIIYEGRAETYPGPNVRSRGADSTTQPPLTRADIRAVTDERCTFRRILTRNAAGAYTWNAPLPACSDYLEP
jgi:hypothetical protein